MMPRLALLAAMLVVPFETALAQSQRPRSTAPEAAVACRFEAWAHEVEPNGLPVLAAPQVGARSISRLPPPVSRGLDEFAVNVTVTGYSPGWFRIAEAAFPPEAYGPGTPKRVVFQGQGWVPAGALKAQLASAELKAAPQANARTLSPLGGTQRMGSGSISFGPDGVAVRRLISCRANWVEVETEFGTGWVARVCAEQMDVCP